MPVTLNAAFSCQKSPRKLLKLLVYGWISFLRGTPFDTAPRLATARAAPKAAFRCHDSARTRLKPLGKWGIPVRRGTPFGAVVGTGKRPCPGVCHVFSCKYAKFLWMEGISLRQMAMWHAGPKIP